jgi:hypothetical protein
MKTLILIALVLISPGFWIGGNEILRSGDVSEVFSCDQQGWYPTSHGLKDHHIFWYSGYYYLVSTYVPPGNPSPLAQDRLAYARSIDLCIWEELSPLLAERVPGGWDETAIWAPFVHFQDGIYYLYYTGVTENLTQSILLATSTNPADPESWQKQDMVFQPSHPGSLWTKDGPADCRDPFLLKQGDLYYLYYTSLDEAGGMIGVATAISPVGPWLDWGSIVAPVMGDMLESPTVVQYSNTFYLFHNSPEVGEFYQIGASPAGPWLEAVPFQPGWAHEIWLSTEGEWFTSYLTDYTVTINRLLWNNSNDVPKPTIDWVRSAVYLPVINLDNQEMD